MATPQPPTTGCATEFDAITIHIEDTIPSAYYRTAVTWELRLTHFPTNNYDTLDNFLASHHDCAHHSSQSRGQQRPLHSTFYTWRFLHSTLLTTTAVWTTNISSTHHTGVEITQVVGKAQGSILAGGDFTTPKSDSQEYDHGWVHHTLVEVTGPSVTLTHIVWCCTSNALWNAWRVARVPQKLPVWAFLELAQR